MGGPSKPPPGIPPLTPRLSGRPPPGRPPLGRPASPPRPPRPPAARRDPPSRSRSNPTVKEAADADPREFLLEVEGHSSKPLVITVKYFACDDAETFCKAVTQRYEVVLERDRDGGSRRAAGGRGGRGGLAGRPSGGRPGGGRPERRGVSGGIPGGGFEGPPTPRVKADPERRQRVRKAASIFREHDKNRDGKLTAKEWPEFKNVEAGDDKQISLDELMTWLKSKQ